MTTTPERVLTQDEQIAALSRYGYGWADPDSAYESAVARFLDGVLGDRALTAHLDEWVTLAEGSARANTLGQKAIQLTMPGVPDVYQGTELVDLSLVDPDNRRPVDYADRGRAPARAARPR